MLHALFENGSVRPSDIESHIKDEVEREGAKVAEMTRKVKQAYSEVVSCYLLGKHEPDL
jgi:transcriptional activator SPT7